MNHYAFCKNRADVIRKDLVDLHLKIEKTKQHIKILQEEYFTLQMELDKKDQQSMKLGQRLNRLEKYCEEVAEFYPIRCEVHVEPGESDQDSDWAWVVAHDLTSSNGNTSRTATSPESPAVNCLEAWLDDLMLKWFGGKGR